MRVLIIFIILLCSACSLPTKPNTNKHDFGVLNSAATKKTDMTITTPDWLYNNCIHYRLLYSSPTELRCYNLDEWIAPPSELLKQYLSYTLNNNQRLVIELNEFEQQFDSKNTAKVIVSVMVAVYDKKTEQLLNSKRFKFSQTTEFNAKGAVLGFSRIIQTMNTEIQAWLNNI